MVKVCLVLCCCFLVSACSSIQTSKFKEGIELNNQIQFSGIDAIASSSTDIIDFANRIYTRRNPKPVPGTIEVEKSLIATKSFIDRKEYKAEDRQILTSYCAARKGSVYQWDVDSKTHEYGLFRGVNKRFVTCEVDSQIESTLIYEAFSRDSTVYPYEVYTTFARGDYVEKLFEDNKIKGYKSSNGMITVPLTKITSPNDRIKFISNSYTVYFSYQNTTAQPVEIDLNNSYAVLNGAKYAISFEKEHVWNRYVENTENAGVFVGNHNKKHMTVLRFNPGQKLSGELSFNIPGVTKLTRADMESLEIHFDGNKCANFKLVPYYELSKNRL